MIGAADAARMWGGTAAEAQARWAGARAALLAARERRPRPHRDEKVLACWNGLMIAALARGERVLADASLGLRAVRAATFAWEQLRDPATGAMRRHLSAGAAAGEGQLDDHAAMAHGFLELWSATQDPVWLARAAGLTRVQVERFWDHADGAFFESPAGDPGVLVRMKDGYDGAEMAGNSLAAGNLVRLAALDPEGPWSVWRDRVLDYHARRLSESPWAMPRMLVAMEAAAHAGRQVVIAGGTADERGALLAVARAGFRPFDEIVVVDDATREALAPHAPFAASLRPASGHATAFVCVDRACRLPVTAPEALASQLDEACPPGAATEIA